jgi:protein CWC15
LTSCNHDNSPQVTLRLRPTNPIRPTFDPARGRDKNTAPTRAFHAKALPAHTKLKLRQQGQTSEVEVTQRNLRAELLAAEAEYRRKSGKAGLIKESGEREDGEKGTKRGVEDEEEDEEVVKRRKIIEESRELDAESEEDSSDERYFVGR